MDLPITPSYRERASIQSVRYGEERMRDREPESNGLDLEIPFNVLLANGAKDGSTTEVIFGTLFRFLTLGI